MFGGAARAMHPSARMKIIVWCDGIDDEIAEAGEIRVAGERGTLPPTDSRYLLISAARKLSVSNIIQQK